MTLREAIGRNVKALRKAMQLNQEELSKRCSLARSYVSRLENGQANVSVESLERVAGALNVDPILLLLECGSLGPTTPAEKLAQTFGRPSLVTWTSEGLVVQPVKHKDDLSLQVIDCLLSEGYSGGGLRHAYCFAYPRIRRISESEGGED